jgi:demethylspheroidene O-methyltransferase
MRSPVLAEFLSSVKAFALARCLIACLELDLFPQLKKQALSRTELMKQLNIPDSIVAESFFDMLISFNVIQEQDDKLLLTPRSEAVFEDYDSMKSWNQEMLLFYKSLADLSGVLKSGRYEETELASFWPYKKMDIRGDIKSEDIDEYSGVMDASQEKISQIIAEQVDLSDVNHVIDFGGGYGRLAFTLVEKHPHLKVTVADLPAVCEETQKRIEAKGLGNRINVLGVDFLKDDLPANTADAILFVRVLHDWSDDHVVKLLKRTRTCLVASGRAVIVEPIPLQKFNHDPASTPTSLMLALLGGKRRSVDEHQALLSQAGYSIFSWKDCGFSIFKQIIAQ